MGRCAAGPVYAAVCPSGYCVSQKLQLHSCSQCPPPPPPSKLHNGGHSNPCWWALSPASRAGANRGSKTSNSVSVRHLLTTWRPPLSRTLASKHLPRIPRYTFLPGGQARLIALEDTSVPLAYHWRLHPSRRPRRYLHMFLKHSAEFSTGVATGGAESSPPPPPSTIGRIM